MSRSNRGAAVSFCIQLDAQSVAMNSMDRNCVSSIHTFDVDVKLMTQIAGMPLVVRVSKASFREVVVVQQRTIVRLAK